MATLVDELPDISTRKVFDLATDRCAHIKSLLTCKRIEEVADEFIRARTLIELIPESYASQFMKDWFNDLLKEAREEVARQLGDIETYRTSSKNA